MGLDMMTGLVGKIWQHDRLMLKKTVLKGVINGRKGDCNSGERDQSERKSKAKVSRNKKLKYYFNFI